MFKKNLELKLLENVLFKTVTASAIPLEKRFISVESEERMLGKNIKKLMEKNGTQNMFVGNSLVLLRKCVPPCFVGTAECISRAILKWCSR